MTNSSKVELLCQLLQNNNHQALGKIAENGDMNIAYSITCSKTVTDVKKLITKGAILCYLLTRTKDACCPIQLMVNKLGLLQDVVTYVNNSHERHSGLLLKYLHLLNLHFLRHIRKFNQ